MRRSKQRTKRWRKFLRSRASLLWWMEGMAAKGLVVLLVVGAQLANAVVRSHEKKARQAQQPPVVVASQVEAADGPQATEAVRRHRLWWQRKQ